LVVLPSGLWLSPRNAASHGSMIAESSEAFTYRQRQAMRPS
jgi:hypothetical protein